MVHSFNQYLLNSYILTDLGDTIHLFIHSINFLHAVCNFISLQLTAQPPPNHSQVPPCSMTSMLYHLFSSPGVPSSALNKLLLMLQEPGLKVSSSMKTSPLWKSPSPHSASHLLREGSLGAPATQPRSSESPLCSPQAQVPMVFLVHGICDTMMHSTERESGGPN